MAVNGEGEVIFCPGCPVQGNFVGPVEVEDGSIWVAQDTAYENGHFSLNMRFEDEDGLSTPTLESRQTNQILREQFAVPMEVSQSGYIKDYDRYKQRLTRRVEPAKESAVYRIERCTGVGSNKECPAFNNTVLGKLIQNALIEALPE